MMASSFFMTGKLAGPPRFSTAKQIAARALLATPGRAGNSQILLFVFANTTVAFGVRRPHGCSVNPGKLFDYLDDKLPEHERHAVEEELMNDAVARREFEVARRIHSATGPAPERLEVIDEAAQDAPRGRRAARQVLLATLVLVAVNVLLGLLYIAQHESRNPNRALLEKQSREQLRKALDTAAAGALTPPSLGLAELSVTAEPGRAATVADEIVQLAQRLDGTATKGIPDGGRVGVLVEIAGKRAAEFQTALANLGGLKGAAVNTLSATGGNSGEKISVLVQVTEAK
jgi:hypothetical protein